MATAVVEERELLKTISWFDGFIVALANPSFLITGLGGSALSLGGWGAVIVWTVSVVIGALHNYIYSETAAMFPKLSGGIAIYAHEAWKKYLSIVGPIAAFGYWIGWSVVLSATGIIVGFLVQSEWYPASAAASSSWNHTWSIAGQSVYFSFPIFLTSVIILVIWAFNVLGMRPAVWVGYVTGALLLIPLAIMMFLPYITGDWSSSNLHNNISTNASAAGVSSLTLVIVWLYVMCWSSYGFECCATFAPEYHDTARDTPKALRVAAIFGVIVYGLLPMGAIGTFGDQNLNASNIYTFMVPTLDKLLGGHSGFAVFTLCAGIVLAMNTATADGSRALFGIARDGMTIRFFGKLNFRNVPANAMTLDAILNIFLLFTYASDAIGALKILVLSNLGYVFCHVMAMSGFALLRKDRPNWPRPIKVARIWLPIGIGLALFDLVLLVVGATNAGVAYGQNTSDTLIPGLFVLACALGLYVIRVTVQDRRKLALRLWAPTMPDEQPPAGAAIE